MPRRRVAAKRSVIEDSRYKNKVVGKFITRMMYCGKKSTSSAAVYEAFDMIQAKLEKEPLEVFLKALDNVKPMVEVKSRRVGGSTYQVPVEIRDSRRDALAMRWIIQFARQRGGKSMSENLGTELMDAYNSTGSAFKKKEDTHRMAEANKAFAHYRW
ncbi:MAG TPA: 30S ribosomal protein S7 [Spirochaetia bacterium]|nr:30S ribosomal protein S7 [Spirochaetia bacterium]